MSFDLEIPFIQIYLNEVITDVLKDFAMKTGLAIWTFNLLFKTDEKGWGWA